jgi:molybdopterin/thiamine biosynthesis adenylyltransferase/nitroreductase
MFSYHEAFSRNLGWLTRNEQEILRFKRVAIAGLGGVGGSHLLTLARLGIGAFHIADFDKFDIANFNRQAGATLSSLGRPKAEVLAEMARQINPELEIKVFPQGVNDDNLSDFFSGVDVYVDGLDFFAFAVRQSVFAACTEMGIPAITAAPIGMGAAVLNFLPGKMTFEEYFRVRGQTDAEKAIRFLLGLSPAMLQMPYLVDKTRVNLAERRGPSTVMACQLCAGLAATEALKLLLNRGEVRAAPRGLHFDAYRNKLARTWRPWGNNNPIQRLGLAIARRQLAAGAASGPAAEQKPLTTIEQILDLARWAPSGDNTQVWRFEIIDEHHVAVHGFNTREHCIYDVNGRPSQIALGALLENIGIAATGHGLRASMVRRESEPDDKPVFDVKFAPDPAVQPDPLLPYIPVRSVQRRRMHTRPLTSREKSMLESALGEENRMLWLEGFAKRLAVARFMSDNAKLRLTLPEAYRVHREVIQWNARYSEERVPDQAVGLDPMTTRLMRWVMESWQRVEFFNRYLAGTLMPRLQLDLVPGIACAAHFVILAREKPATIDDYVSAGRAVQRFWLTATRLGLQLQPEMTPLIFASYVREGKQFSATPGSWKQARHLSSRLAQLIGEGDDTAVFMGRIGAGRAAEARSLRIPLDRLFLK